MTTKAAPPILFDAARAAQNRNRAASSYAQYDFLKARESSALSDRLADISRRFPRALDHGAHTGQAGEALLASGQVDEVIALEAAPAMRSAMAARGIEAKPGELEHLPFDPASFDLVASILSLHWANDLPGTLVQIRQILKPDGLFLGCLFGAGTLTELRTSLIEAESSLTGGATPRISPLPSLQDMAGLMQRAGFALPVADIDHVTVRYDSPLALMADLRGMGEQAAFAPKPDQPRRPLSRRLLARLDEVYRDRFADPDGRLRASFEIIWLSGWAPAPNQPKPLRPGSGKVSLADAVKRAGQDK